jgi:hypothetical protein
MARQKKPYKAKSLLGAQAYVRSLVKQVDQLSQLIERLAKDRRLLAQLAAKGPCFHNPLVAMQAELLRDGILRQELRLNPDGTPISAAAAATPSKAVTIQQAVSHFSNGETHA